MTCLRARARAIAEISSKIESLLSVRRVTPSRLLSIIGDSVKWNQHISATCTSIYYDNATSHELSPSGIVDFGIESRPESFLFSSNHIIIGSFDGCVEFWHHSSLQLDTDLTWQDSDDLIMMGSSISSLAVSDDFIACGDSSGSIAVYRSDTGTLCKDLPHVYSSAISSLSFNSTSASLLSSSYCTMMIHSANSSQQPLHVHTCQSAIVMTVFDNDDVVLIACMNSVVVYDITACCANIIIAQTTSRLIHLSNNIIVTMDGTITDIRNHHSIESKISVRNAAVGRNKAYLADGLHQLIIVDIASGKIDSTLSLLRDDQVHCICLHVDNIVAISYESGKLQIWG